MKNKKLFAILTLVCFMFTLMPVAAMAEGETEVTPENITEIKFEDDGVYKFTGEFANEVSIEATAGKEMIFDAEAATFGNHVKFKINRIADNKTDLVAEKTGNYCIRNFEISDSLSIGALATTVTIESCKVEAIDFNVSNTDVRLNGNKIVSLEDSYTRFDGNSNNCAVYVYADNYSLTITENTIIAKDDALRIHGNYEEFQSGNGVTIENSISLTKNTLHTDGEVLINIWNDVTYAPVQWPEQHIVTEAAQNFATEVLNKNNFVCIKNIDILNILSRATGQNDSNLSEENHEDLIAIFENVTKENPAFGHTSGDTVIENKTEATYTETGSYDEVVYCAYCEEELSRVTTEIPVLESPDESEDSSSSSGGFSGQYNYPVNIADVDGATVTSSENYAVAGETVTITVDPEAGKQLDEVIVTDADGDVIPVTKAGDNKYTFTMPAGKVNVAVTTEAADYDLRIVMQINNKNIVVNNRTFTNDVAPVIVGDRTLVPVRIVTELLGGTADWKEETRIVTLRIDGKVLTMTIDQPIPGFGTSAVIMNDRTYVPIRYVAENLGASVEWIAETQQIIIEK